MKWLIWCLFAFLLIALTDQSIKQFAQLAHVSNGFGVLRDVIMVGLFFYGLANVNFFENRKMAVAVFGMMIFICLYMLESAMFNRHVVGFYYARSYAIPVLFFVGCYAVILRSQVSTVYWLLRRQALINCILVILAFVEYAYVLLYPWQVGNLFGSKQIAASWYIAGGVHMRMGLPFVSANSFGTYCALSALLAVIALFSDSPALCGRRLQIFSLLLSLCGLLGSLSRSAVLLMLIGLGICLAMPGIGNILRVKRITLYGGILTVMAAMVLLGLEKVSDGHLSRWLMLTFHGNDPSLAGHISTFSDAYNDFYHYALYGYPRGTVGPKAVLFGNTINNVENSTIGLIYDLGLPCAIVFVFLYFCMLSSAWFSRIQVGVALGFFVNAQFLPYIFESELICYFLFVYVLVGYLAEKGMLKTLLEQVPKKTNGLTSSTSLTGTD